jgi:glycosyltransferase involved in cell wall biosynthesis
MSEPALARHVCHFGPSTRHVGGMASVIKILVTHRLGAQRATAIPTWVPGSHPRSALLAVRAAAIVLRMPRLTVVHVHMSEGGSFIREALVLAAARARGLPRVVTIHGPGFAEFAARRPRLVARVLSMASAVTVLSNADLAVVLRLAPQISSEILANPIPLRPAAVPVRETEEVVLFAGEVGLRKGADVLRRAWETASVRRPLARCIIVGPPTDLHIEPAERLEVRGPVNAAEMERLICQARVIALPSRGEALPMILIEAMAAGRPFVATPTGGVASLAGCGLLVPVEDHQALAEALIELLANRERADSLAARGEAMCRERMSPDAVSGRLARLYR